MMDYLGIVRDSDYQAVGLRDERGLGGLAADGRRA
jgi:hypothetical protein